MGDYKGYINTLILKFTTKKSQKTVLMSVGFT